jgi:hypothetical protein
MPLIIEDGSGKADADSYQTVAAFKLYCDDRGMSYAGHSDADIERALRQGTNYIDTAFRYKGNRSLASQALEFPRSNLVDWSGFTITGLPVRVVRACSELAFRALSQPLMEDLDRGGKVVSESVGSISVTYAQDAPAGKTWQAAQKLLEPYIRDPNERGSPYFTEPSGSAFSFDMHSNLTGGL